MSSLAEIHLQLYAFLHRYLQNVQNQLPAQIIPPNASVLNIEGIQPNTRESFIIKRMSIVYATIKCNKTWGIFRRHDLYYVEYTQIFNGSKHLCEDTRSKNYESVALCIEDIKRKIGITDLDEVRVLNPSGHPYPYIIL